MRENTAKAILENVKKTYSDIANDFSKSRNNKWNEFDSFLEFIENKDNVADIGCGNGRFYKFLREKRDSKYVGIDNNKELLKEARHLNKADFIEGDILKIPLEERSQDVTVCIAALHHIPSKKLRNQAIEELARITKPKGHLLLSVWNLLEQEKYKKYVVKAFVKWLYTMGKFEKRGLFIPWQKERDRYYYAFKESELEKMLDKDFKIIKKTKGNNIVLICEKK
jgi:tRNA (uracil-5-)-methyltransferase TRM9